MMCAVQITSCGMICVPSFMKIGLVIQSILKFCLSNLNGYNDVITDERDL
jgi:hypothetical protein